MADPALQIVDELDRTLAGPVGSLLGLDLSQQISQRILVRAPMLAAQLSEGADDRLAAQTVIDLMTALWPHASPEHVGHADWWRTPVGRLCARSLGRDDAEAVTQHVAGAMLGVTRGTIAQMLARGTLDRHPDGGVLRASILQRLGRH